ncbi:ser-thr-rich glycosyl-phosphatidyl-inositol-anchored membrane family [Pyrrhoderma noxium]|uniref:Ser-thr-rich glycosyl-phosphatidyl-inositol-anchored membrane family n=1 Tax=Pyrrhoderma noxium TaxID=2282107 RepID=A0A286UJJ1_9AGAM|nr:ser-thr-rich glycosyl-phosphatidyl-inositol-anchored membrane family [Pyrrhoderma noxium]
MHVTVTDANKSLKKMASLFTFDLNKSIHNVQIFTFQPAPGTVFKQGETCTIQWAVDTTGTWTETNIELMTGSNLAMVHLTTVATVDGTKESSYSWTCPEVTPNSAIYFYQFSSPAEPTNLTWTGRWTISASDGSTTDPTETTDGIQWGTGALVDASSAVAAPTYLSGSTVASTSAGSSTPSVTEAVTTSASVPLSTISITSVSATGALTATGSLSTRVVTASSAGTSGAAAQASSAAESTTNTSGASALAVDLKTRGLQALVGLAGTALVFVTMF